MAGARTNQPAAPASSVSGAGALRRIHRRQLLQLALAALALAPACSLLDRPTEFEAAVDDLSQALSAVADTDSQNQQLQSLAAATIDMARALSRSHSRFIRKFKSNLADAAISREELVTSIDSYDRQYRADLTAMLTLQDQLHQALDPEEWRQVAASLNATAVRLDNRVMVDN